MVDTSPLYEFNWTVDEDFLNEAVDLSIRGPIKKFKPRFLSSIKLRVSSLGLDAGWSGANMNIYFARNGNEIGFLAVQTSNGKTGQVNLYVPRGGNRTSVDPAIKDIKYIVSSFIRNPTQAVDTDSRDQSISALTIARNKLNLGKDTTADLTGRLTEYLGSPTVPGRLIRGGITRKRKHSKKSRSRKHKKTRKH